jgi:hypothetical protein
LFFHLVEKSRKNVCKFPNRLENARQKKRGETSVQSPEWNAGENKKPPKKTGEKSRVQIE